MNRKSLAWMAIAAAALIFGGCSTTGGKGGEVSNGSQGATVVDSGSGATTSAANQSRNWKGNPLDNPDSLLSSRVVYFDFDKSELLDTSMMMLRAHAEYLSTHQLVNITVEGHCDERGSREYNVGLGERRADAIKRFLEAEGVSSSQINTISYGEERPADFGTGETAWAKNRRGVLVY